ncbi:GGDEF-domain containing protein [Xenophilus sp. AP218F]|nr:GGDEF-domain containing protein [Xenophilus sp. AP218F]
MPVEHGQVAAWQENELDILAALSLPVWVFDIDRQRVFWANPPALEVWGAQTLAELKARDMGADMSISVLRRLRQYQQDFERDNARFTETWTLYPNGAPRSLQVVFSGVRLDGRVMMLCQAPCELSADPATLRSAEALLHTSVRITLYGSDGQALYRNPAARAQATDAAQDWSAHFVASSDAELLSRQVRAQGEGRLLALVHTPEGERWHEISARACRDAVSGEDAMLVSEVDITDLKHAEAQACYLASHDVLTGLPNRNYVLNDFQHQLKHCLYNGHEVALMFIDLDRFKNVNDSLGHASGDELLVRMAERLRALLRKGDLVARLGGDEFLVLVTAPQVADNAAELARRILTALSQPVRLRGIDVSVSASIGISVCRDRKLDVDSLMRHADLAMYAAKDAGRNGLYFYTPALEARTQAQLTLESEIRAGLENGQFEAFFQPRVEVASGKIVGAEALARWRHPQRGLLPPETFIPVCEDSGLIIELGRQILDQAAAWQCAWSQKGWPLNVSVNLSPCQFTDPGLTRMVGEVLARHACCAPRLELEITESVLLGQDEATLHKLNALREMGLGIALDDFGTGYSNLAYLQRYPLTTLKIDRSFVTGLADAPALTEMIVALCRMLKLHMVAEGVDAPEQLDWLRRQGCHEYQGYLFSEPLSAADFESLIEAARGADDEERPAGARRYQYVE